MRHSSALARKPLSGCSRERRLDIASGYSAECMLCVQSLSIGDVLAEHSAFQECNGMWIAGTSDGMAGTSDGM